MRVTKDVTAGLHASDLFFQALRSADFGHVLIIGESLLQDQLLPRTEMRVASAAGEKKRVGQELAWKH